MVLKGDHRWKRLKRSAAGDSSARLTRDGEPKNAEWVRKQSCEAQARRRAKSPEKVRKINREAMARWYETEEGKAYSREYHITRLATDPTYRLSCSVRKRVPSLLRSALAGRSGQSLELLGCTAPDYKLYLEGLFEPGMTWENWGEWHIDHVRPFASFDLSDPNQQRAAFHYLNTRPSWASENLSKGSVYDGQRWRHCDHG